VPRAAALLPDLSPLRRHRSFRLLWFGQLVSQAGTQVRLVALPYQIYLLTGSSLHVGLIGLFQAIPLSSNVCADLEGASVTYQKLGDDPERPRYVATGSKIMVSGVPASPGEFSRIFQTWFSRKPKNRLLPPWFQSQGRRPRSSGC